MQQAITALGKSGFAGVYAANDDTGGGAIAAMKSAGIDPEERPTTGQDATVSGVQRILVGQQYMTVYKATDKETKVAAEIAVALAEGEEFPKSKITDEPNNGKVKVPSVLLEPVAVTKANVKQTVVADGFITAEELCTGPYVKACEEAGIS
jgi:D-xylose transport system substrate-binding protein